MNDWFVLFLDRTKFTFELFLACALFSLPLERRSHYPSGWQPALW